MKIVGKLGRRQVVGLFLSCIPFFAYGKLAASSEKPVELPDYSLKPSAQFYLLSGWVLAENDLEFFSARGTREC